MRIIHSAVTSSVFELVKTIEFDLIVGEDSFSIRFELFRDIKRRDHFRCHVWELKFFRLMPTFPMDDTGQPQHVSDDMAIVERSAQLNKCYDDFIAPNPEAALNTVLEDFKTRLEHWTGKEAFNNN